MVERFFGSGGPACSPACTEADYVASSQENVDGRPVPSWQSRAGETRFHGRAVSEQAQLSSSHPESSDLPGSSRSRDSR